MAEPIEFTDLTSPAYKLETVNAACSVMINWFCELIEKGPRAGKLRLRQIPGLKRFATLSGEPMRALLAVDGGNRLFGIAGGVFYEIFRDGTSVAFTGNVALGSNPAIMVSNGFQIGIASGGFGYLANGAEGGGGTVIPLTFTDGTPVRAGTMTFLDNYLIANEVNTKSVRISDLAPDGATWNADDAKIKEGRPDNIACVFADNEQLWVFGFDSTEVWAPSDSTFPFDRIQGAVIPIGTDAPYSVAGIAGMRAWLWHGVVYGAYGMVPERISDFGVEQAIASYTKQFGTVADAEAWCYQQGGHDFYVIAFPTAQKCWVYDRQLKAWHERAFWNNGQYQRYRPRVYAKAFGKDLVGDWQTGVIYEMDPETYTDADGVELRRQRTCPYLTAMNKNLRYNQLTLDCDTGVGLNVGLDEPGFDPKVQMRYSDNRGKTYSSWLDATLGEKGEDDIRIIFNQLGSSRIGKTFELVVTDPVPSMINTAYLNIGQPTPD